MTSIPFASQSFQQAQPLGLSAAARGLATRIARTVTSLRREVATYGAYAEAERLRDVASRYQSSDPSFAQDLYAAADRHEIEAARA